MSDRPTYETAAVSDGIEMLTEKSDSITLYQNLCEAVEKIETLKRERDEARRERDELIADLHQPELCNETMLLLMKQRNEAMEIAEELCNAAAFGLSQWESGYTLEACKKIAEAILRFQRMKRRGKEAE